MITEVVVGGFSTLIQFQDLCMGLLPTQQMLIETTRVQ